ncbi:heparinase II/III family protein [Gemmatimonas sp.]|uniref:heparinase II/III domain-containing protein n=1 Tax=Gemmatimonas sp. TaxID=1962908 RepID=UPI003982F63C
MKRLPLLPLDLHARRRETAVGSSLAPTIQGLAAELEPLLLGELPIPRQKARLTRAGGRCPVHGVLLEFDPRSPHAHRCKRCDRAYTGVEHDDWWAMGAQLYTAERAVHAATLYALRGEPKHAALAVRILSELADRYGQWPNRDNVLGPTRPFFSTYLESIWLLNICHALDLLDAAIAPGAGPVGARLREQLIAPSAALIASFHEATSNRQVWNEVAVLSAFRVLDDQRAFQRRLEASDGLLKLMEQGLLADGSWYEGENYHFFAHRALWYGMQLLAAAGLSLPAALGDRYASGFVTPFLGLLPDETIPSRRDSPYAVSIRQWRFAEWCELGHAHRADPRLAGLLSRLYDGSLTHHSNARARSTADAERNEGPSALSRADLSWRSVLMASAQPVPAASVAPASVVLPSQGLAVLRREHGQVYVALEGGHSGSGHGHPDRLALTLHTGPERWLQDPGTGSYVERTLYWYRSTLAHHAPLVNGGSQPTGSATLVAFEDRGGMGWIQKRASIGQGLRATRTIVVCEGYCVDLLEWGRDPAVAESASAAAASDDITITLPVCGDALRTTPFAFAPTLRPGAGGLEDGFDFLHHVESVAIEGTAVIDAIAVTASGAPGHRANAQLLFAANVPTTLIRARTPGAPGCNETVRHAVELHGPTGRLVSVWHWKTSEEHPAVHRVLLDARSGAAPGGEAPGESPVARITTADGTTAVHGPAPHGWHIELLARHARSSVDLEGLVTDSFAPIGAEANADRIDAAVASATPLSLPLHMILGEAHYLRTEQSWNEAGSPTATVHVALVEGRVHVEVVAHTGVVVPPDGVDNPLDNERAQVNADGVQWYWGTTDGRWGQAALCTPSGSTVLMTRLVPGDWPLPEAACTALADDRGWRVRFEWKLADLPIASDGTITFDLVVNERPANRIRRRGQLLLSGRLAAHPSAGAYAYLRGDRHSPAHSLRLRIGTQLLGH